MNLCCHGVIFIAICLASSTAYPKLNTDCNKAVINKQENSESNENTAKCLSTEEMLQSDKNTSPNIVLTNEDFSTLLNIAFTNDAKAIEVISDVINSKKNNENPVNTLVTTTPNTPTTIQDDLPLSDILLSQLTHLSQDDVDEASVGQKIEFKLSNLNSDTDMVNPAGVEILKNTSVICGSLIGKRISFANATTLMEFPWTALLLYNTKLRYHCGGSLITTKYVLTAAHCVAQEFYELSGVRLGEHDITEERDCAPDLAGDDICATTIDVNVVKIIVHHAYSHLSFKNDIALLKLDNDYLGRSFYPICIPNPENTYDAKQATVAGWGATEKTIRSAVLLKADVPILDITKCREIYRYSVFNDSTEICGSGVNEVDVCKGDSGGALFYQEYVNRKQKYHQLGIVSLGVRTCGDNRLLPAVFTKVKGFYKWIENNLEY